MSILKKLFYRNNIKDATPTTQPATPPTYPLEAIRYCGYKASCSDVEAYLENFINPPAHDGGPKHLYVGQMELICPNCHLIIYGEDFGQILSIGSNTLSDRPIAVVKTDRHDSIWIN